MDSTTTSYIEFIASKGWIVNKENVNRTEVLFSGEWNETRWDRRIGKQRYNLRWLWEQYSNVQKFVVEFWVPTVFFVICGTGGILMIFGNRRMRKNFVRAAFGWTSFFGGICEWRHLFIWRYKQNIHIYVWIAWVGEDVWDILYSTSMTIFISSFSWKSEKQEGALLLCNLRIFRNQKQSEELIETSKV